MRRLTASLLLLFALVGTFAPLALAATAAPPHACCRRMAHQCHGVAAPDSQLSFHNTSCCNHDCCRALTTSQWAHAQPNPASVFTNDIRAFVTAAQENSLTTHSSESPSTRAPPLVSLA